MNTAQKSIGAWVKITNDVFTNLTRTTKDYGSFNRLEWQFLNYLKENEITTETAITDFLSFFTKENEIKTLIEHFENEGLISSVNSGYQITRKGKMAYSEVLKIQEEIKVAAMKGINDEAYETTISTLSQMIENLKPYSPN
ncbi:hypothetical protein PW52_04650 [Tamlana sedimentorum]|uniref:HTH marR-type domain-containing protein n=1 Tax=Neotamlana sedimentorum TaxID=1435349 RepID=A0A0D7WBF9_9FLAO|nr:hypothetical protein [Tamlana sedimentorum]KJD36451.1 hypothetical protein PW52_04650 [Tamlana sedimentorum]